MPPSLFRLIVIETEDDGKERATEHIVQKHRPSVFYPHPHFIRYLRSHHDFFRDVFQAQGNFKLSLILVVQRLQKPKAERDEDKKQKNQKLPARCAEQKVSDSPVNDTIISLYVLFVEHNQKDYLPA